MQEALRSIGFDEGFIAASVMAGMRAEDKGLPDVHARHKYLTTGAELLDAFPTKKLDLTHHGLEEALDGTEKDGEVAPWGASEGSAGLREPR